MAPALTVTVGQKNEQILGNDDRALQAGVDYLARLGGGTLKIGPGVYRLTNSVRMRTGIRIEGAGEDTVLLKNDGIRSQLAEDSDWYLDSVVVAETPGFEVGNGIVLQAKDPHGKRNLCSRFTIVGRDGNRLLLDRQLEDNFWVTHEASAATLFPLICAEKVRDLGIRNLTLDGNRDRNENLNGNYGGAVFMQNCQNVAIDSVTARNYNGDGFSWQIVHDLTITNCKSLNNAGLSYHPGSGSLRPVIRNNLAEGGHLGIFFCWGVKHGIAEGNRIVGPETGVSIGHRDTDNIVRNNDIIGATKVGLGFRDEIETRAGHRNRIEGNRFVDCGPADAGKALETLGKTNGVAIVGNTFEEARPAANATAIVVGADVSELTLGGNTFSGFAVEVEDQREGE